MQISDHSLRQFDDAYLERLEEKALRSLSGKLLADLKEARERLNQTSQNSSRPPSSQAPWERPSPPEPELTEEAEDGTPKAPPKRTPDTATQRSLPEVGAESKAQAGKQKGAKGVGRAAPDRVDRQELHEPKRCAGCQGSLGEIAGSVYTGYYEVDGVRVEGGWQVRWTPHRWVEKTCPCGLMTRAMPWRDQAGGTECGPSRRP